MRSWSELTTREFQACSAEATVAVLPVAAVEQHGPHLPLGTDALILEGVLNRVAVEAGMTVLRLPMQAIGHSLEHVGFPGTLHVDPETLIAQWAAIGRCVRRAGVRKLAIVNSHGGQPQVVDLVAIRLRDECQMLVTRVNTFALGTPAGLFPEDELRHGFHGGEVETSMMLALRPDLVVDGERRPFANRMAERSGDYEVLGAEEPVGFAWTAQDLNPEGVTGDASRADAARGGELLDYLAGRLAAVLRDMAKFPLSDLDERPRP